MMFVSDKGNIQEVMRPFCWSKRFTKTNSYKFLALHGTVRRTNALVLPLLGTPKV